MILWKPKKDIRSALFVVKMKNSQKWYPLAVLSNNIKRFRNSKIYKSPWKT